MRSSRIDISTKSVGLSLFHCARASVSAALFLFVGHVFGQATVTFPAPISLQQPNASFKMGKNQGVSAAVFNGLIYTAWESDADTPCLVAFNPTSHASSLNCIQSQVPAIDGSPQITVFENKLYIAFAEASSHQLVIASSSNGTTFTYVEPNGIFVAPSPAIAVTSQFTGSPELFVAYQENQQDHHLGIASSTNGVDFSSSLASAEIGHSPGMATLRGGLIIAAFCQCDQHYLQTFNANGTLLTTTSQTVSNSSPPSLTVTADNTLVVGYIQNGQRYFQTSTSYDGVNWTSPVEQGNIANDWGGPGLTVYNGEIYAFYVPQNPIPGYPNSYGQQEAVSFRSAP